jgi:hypothetical protein
VLLGSHKAAARRGLTVGVMVGIAGLMTGALLFLALTGCGAGGSGAGGSGGTGQAQSVQQQSRAVWLRFARCARSHGAPDFPDPNLNSQGQASFPNEGQVKQETSQVQGACGAILRQLPAAARNSSVTAAQLRQLKAFAHCLRSHGMPTWPDPKPDGTFPIVGTPLAAGGKTPAFISADQACRNVYPGGISAS